MAAQQARGDRECMCLCAERVSQSFQNAPTSISSLLSFAIILHFALQHTFAKRVSCTQHKHTHNLCPLAGAKLYLLQSSQGMK